MPVSLHKWLIAPFGTGFLQVRKEYIARIRPLLTGEPMTFASSRRSAPLRRRHGSPRRVSRPQFEYSGIRVTPNIYMQLEEVDTFATAMEDILKNGITG